MKRKCFDKNPKIVNRVYNWDGKLVQFFLCESHCKDPDFSNFISEEKLS